MFKKLFRSNPDQLSKFDFWKKWEIVELIEDLHKAAEMLVHCSAEPFGSFPSAMEFHEALLDAIDEVELGNNPDIKPLYDWFAPASAWAHFTGSGGAEIGNRIFDRVEKWYDSRGRSEFGARN